MSFINYLNCADAKNYFHPFLFSSLSHNVQDCQDLILNITPIFVAALTSSILNQSNRYPCFRVFYKNLNLKLGSVSLNCFWTGQKAILPEPCRGTRVWPCSHIFHTISSRSAPEISPALPVFYIALSEILKSHVKLIFCSEAHRMMVSRKRNRDCQHWSSWLRTRPSWQCLKDGSSITSQTWIFRSWPVSQITTLMWLCV